MQFAHRLSIESIPVTNGQKYAVIDGKGSQMHILSSLYDAGLVLRYLIGKSMSREECNHVAALLRADKSDIP